MLVVVILGKCGKACANFNWIWKSFFLLVRAAPDTTLISIFAPKWKHQSAILKEISGKSLLKMRLSHWALISCSWNPDGCCLWHIFIPPWSFLSHASKMCQYSHWDYFYTLSLSEGGSASLRKCSNHRIKENKWSANAECCLSFFCSLTFFPH